MDYCARCRRHLNLQFNCPGCGTPAWELHKYAEAVDETTEPPEPAGHVVGGAAGEADVTAAAEESGVEATGAGDTRRGGDVRSPGGRRAGLRTPRTEPAASRAAARRRRGGRGPGRALLIAGCLLGALGLGVAAVGGREDPTTSAAAAADTAPSQDVRSAPSPQREAASATPAGDQASPSASVTASASATPSPSPSLPAADPADQASAGAGQDARPPGATDPEPAPSRPAPTATSAPPRPTPTPSPTCERVLWWCT